MWLLSKIKKFTADDARKNVKKHEDKLLKETLEMINTLSSIGYPYKKLTIVEDDKVTLSLLDNLTKLGFECKADGLHSIMVSWKNKKVNK